MEKLLCDRFPPYFELRYIDALLWRWLSDKPVRWHVSFVLDCFIYGRRFVFCKVGCMFAKGAGSSCDSAFKEYLDMFDAERGQFPNRVFKDVDRITVCVPAMMALDKYDADETFQMIDSAATYFAKGHELDILIKPFTLDCSRRSAKWHQIPLFEVSNG